MSGRAIDEVIGEQLKGMKKGQYVLLVAAIRRLGGELRIDPAEFSRMIVGDTTKMSVDASEGTIVLKLLD